MRNFNFELRPADIIAQSNAAIRKMQENNEVLEDARRAANSYINVVQERELDSGGYRNIEMKMRDFKKVIDGLQLANDLDIADHNTLIGAVGTQNLIGSEIEFEVNSVIRNITARDIRIDFLDRRIRGGCHCGAHEFLRGLGIAGNAMSLGMRIAGDCTCIINDRNNKNAAIRLRDIDIDLRDSLLEKAAKYDAIEASTRKLFSQGRDIRTEAIRGIGIITQAADSLPNNYFHRELAGWRTSIAEARNMVGRCPDLAWMEGLQLERFIVFDEFSNIVGYDWESIRNTLEQLNAHFANGEYEVRDFAALVFVFTSLERYEDIGRFLSYMAVRENDIIHFWNGLHLDFAGDNEAWREYMLSRGLDPGNYENYITIYTSNENARDYTLWSFNPEFIGRFRLETEALFINAVIESGQAEGEFARERANSNMSRIAERSDMLGLISQIQGYVTSLRGENGPHIRIDSIPDKYENRVGYRLAYTTSGLFGQHVYSRDDGSILQDRWEQNHMFELSFVATTPSLPSAVLDYQIFEKAEESLTARHRPNLSVIITDNILSATPIPTGIADVSKTTLSRLKKKFPVTGLVYAAFSISYGSWSDYKVATETVGAVQEAFDIGRLNLSRNSFHLLTSVITDNSNGLSFTTRITSDTLTVIDELNTVIKNYMEAGIIIQTDEGLKNITSGAEFPNLEYPIIVSDINTNLSGLQTIYSNRAINDALESLRGGGE